jgi:hypothetical protein
VPLLSLDHIQQELAMATSPDDFFGKEGILARLFAGTLEQMLEAELTAHLGYERYAPAGRNSGKSRNGKRTRTLRTSPGDTPIKVPHDRQGPCASPLPSVCDRFAFRPIHQAGVPRCIISYMVTSTWNKTLMYAGPSMCRFIMDGLPVQAGEQPSERPDNLHPRAKPVNTE